MQEHICRRRKCLKFGRDDSTLPITSKVAWQLQ
jgi:hypothetical protein